ncbi:hypothetical protein [Pectobacterium atrosepticum]|uniref:hypothetical protein n=1 Tax=Pectobacterium atrosepticum TaxID=29471 RepID=UPI00203BF358|nr:hypothetical protein [Pectobacterium atrosepticum]
MKFEIWKEKGLLPLIKKQVFKNLEQQYSVLLTTASFSSANIETYGFDRIYDIIVEKKLLNQKQITRLNSVKEKINFLEQNSSYSQLLSYFHDEARKIICDIIEKKNPTIFH